MTRERNTLGFRIERMKGWTSATILIDGIRLIDRVRELEQIYAAREGTPSLAGSYSSLTIEETFLPCRLL